MVKNLRYGTLVGLFILVIDAAVPLILAQRAQEKRAEATAAVAITEQLQLLLSAYQDAESGQRGFMITGQETFLEPYRRGHAALQLLLPQLGETLRDDPRQYRRFRQLLDLSGQEAEFQRQRIDSRRRGEPASVEDAARGKFLMDGIRVEIGALDAWERQRASALLGEVARMENVSRTSIVAITAIDILLFVILYAVAARAMMAQRRSQRALQQSHAQLTDEIAQRREASAELERAAARLSEIVQMQGALAQAQLALDSFLEQVVDRILKVTSASGAVVELIDGEDMVYRTASGTIAGHAGMRLSRRGSLSGQSITENTLLVSIDTHDDPRVDRAACDRIDARSMVVAPLLREGEPIGVLKIVAGAPAAFGGGDIQAVQLVAGFLGSALGHQLQFDRNRMLLQERSRQQETLRALTDAIPALVAFVDTDERYRYCNQQYEPVFGVPCARILGQTVREFLGEELYPQCKAAIDSALAGHAAVCERTVRTPRGLQHQECRHVPQFDAAGRTTGFYMVAWDITERKAQEIEWQSRASTDQLTGLMNRVALLEKLQMTVARHQREGTALAVFYLDVDRFKQINDTHGHGAGDAVLQAFAAYLTMSVRQSDAVARLGGDEFCVLLDNIRTPDNATAVADKILALARIPVVYGEHRLQVSTSIGIAYAHRTAATAEQLIALADTALYKAKQRGRDRYAVDVIGESVPGA